MSHINWETLAKWCIISIAVTALLIGFIYGLVKLEEYAEPNDAATERAIAHACDPLKNREVDYHGAGWSNSSRYEITCSDGSQRIVYSK